MSAAKIKVEIGPVQETLLIPLMGRAIDAEREPSILNDRKSLEIYQSLDYDFSKWKAAQSLAGACVRAEIFDQAVLRFMNAHPEGSIVELGPGLNTRYERLDRGQNAWIELDFEDTIALRRQFFEETPRRRMGVADLSNLDWLGELQGLPEPYFFVSEAVLIYLKPEIAEATLRGLSERFKGSYLMTDLMSVSSVRSQAKHPMMKKLDPSSWYQWGVDDSRDLEAWGYKLLTEQTFMDISAESQAKLPWMLRWGMRWVPGLIRKMLDNYRLVSYKMVGEA